AALLRDLRPALVDRPVARAVADDADAGAGGILDRRTGDVLLGGFELARQPVHVVHVVVRTLAVEPPIVVTGAPGEVRGHAGAGDGAVRNTVAVHVLVAAPLAQPGQRILVEDLAAVEWPLG